MGKKCKKTECPAGEKWAVPFADFLSLLLALFIALYALASVNTAKMQALKEAFVDIYASPKSQQLNPVMQMDSKPANSTGSPTDGALEGSKSIMNSDSVTQQQMAQMKQAVMNSTDLFDQSSGGGHASLNESEQGVEINLPSSLLFKKNSAQVNDEDSLLFLKRVVTIIKQMPAGTNVLVNGYTDDLPPDPSSGYSDNWQLSAARAASVVKQLITDGVPGERLGAVGYAQYKPIVPNDSESDREKNRRVSISFIAGKPTPALEGAQKDILDHKATQH